MDIVAILLLSAIVLIPYSVVMAAIAIFGTRQKWQSAQQTIKNIKDAKVRGDSKSRILLATHVLSSLMVIGALMCGGVIIVVSYLEPTAIDHWFTFEEFRIAVIGFLLSITLAGVVLGIFGNYLVKKLFDK